jgi:prevent-host-death family protein
MTNPSDIKPITYLKANAADLLNHINETHRPVIITQNGEARAVLQDPESYEATLKAISILKLLSLGEDDVQKGKVADQAKVFERIKKKLKR